MAEVAYQQILLTVTCCSCAMEFAMPSEFQSRRIKDHETFYCPAGHPQVYTGKSQEEQLRDQLASRDAALAEERRRLEFERNARRSAEAQRTKAQNKLKKLTHRVNCGVCPHCKRTFKQLAAHMKTQHPERAGG